MSDWLGWTATAVFTSSYFFTRPGSLRRVQMIAAIMWVAYGVLVDARPVIVANFLVLGAAAIAGRKESASQSQQTTAAGH
jgi:hypothetical protein